ncbi:MAG: hypothetical protein AB1641_15795 [Thermodesulfobacteriota bacterium]
MNGTRNKNDPWVAADSKMEPVARPPEFDPLDRLPEEGGRFVHIIGLIRSMTWVQPDREFTRRVMERLPEDRPAFRWDSWVQWIGFRLRVQAPKPLITSEESALCLFLVGFFHLAMAAVIWLGLPPLTVTTTGRAWLGHQSLFLTVAAAWLLVFSLWTWRPAGEFMTKVRWAAGGYLTIQTINAFISFIKFESTLSMGQILGPAAGGLFLGIFLVVGLPGSRGDQRGRLKWGAGPLAD